MPAVSEDNLLQRLRDPDDRPVCAAPLAGWTDAPYRGILRELGARHMWAPFISSHALKVDSENRAPYLDEVAGDRCHAQIFGNAPNICADAARMLEEAGARSIDFNCGCSVRKVHKGGGGSALLKDLDLLVANLKAIVGAVTVPVSMKTRLGFSRDDRLSGVEACRRAADLGCAWVTLHGRTAKQGFDGAADWEAIARLADELPIPVIGNGDVFTPQEAERMFDETGCAGVMVGRGQMGDPWLVGDCEKYLQDGVPRPRRGRAEVAEVMLAHQRALLDHFGVEKGMLEFRKHIARYLRGFPQAARLRGLLVRMDDPGEIERIIREFGRGRPPEEIVSRSGVPT